MLLQMAQTIVRHACLLFRIKAVQSTRRLLTCTDSPQASECSLAGSSRCPATRTTSVICRELLIGDPVSKGGCEFYPPGWLEPILCLDDAADLGPAAKHATCENPRVCGSGRKALVAHLAEVFDEGLNGLRGFPLILSIALPELELHVYVIDGGKVTAVRPGGVRTARTVAGRRGARHTAWRRGARHTIRREEWLTQRPPASSR